MIDNLDILEQELVTLLRPHADDFKHTGMSRSATERIDGYVTILRQALEASSLCYIDGDMAFFDGRAYTQLSSRSLTLIVANILPEFGVGASDAKKIGDMPFSVLFKKSYHRDQTKVCFINCVYDIQRNQSYLFDKRHITDYALPYEWRADATCPMPRRGRACRSFSVCAILTGSGSASRRWPFSLVRAATARV